MSDVKIKVIDSDKLINAINEGSYDVNLSAIMALGAAMVDTKKQEICEGCRNQYDGDRLAIETVPSAQRWIPCSARLPEIGKKVLLSESNTMFIAAYHGSGDPEGVWLVDGYVDEYHHYLADVNRCEWMPLPDRGKGI